MLSAFNLCSKLLYTNINLSRMNCFKFIPWNCAQFVKYVDGFAICYHIYSIYTDTLQNNKNANLKSYRYIQFLKKSNCTGSCINSCLSTKY
ncbi:hypothetical protein C0J52_19819 [Blattella germanica]|nr:hypothetical protein C0J52_19819 [Blattella germanica]